MAFALRADILTWDANIAQSFRVGKFDFCAVGRVEERLAIAAEHFETRFTLQTLHKATCCVQFTAARLTMLHWIHAVSVSGRFFWWIAGVFQTRIKIWARRVAWSTLQTLVSRLSLTVCDLRSWAERTWWLNALLIHNFEPGCAIYFLSTGQGVTIGIASIALLTLYAIIGLALRPVNVFRVMLFIFVGLVFLVDLLILEFARRVRL